MLLGLKKEIPKHLEKETIGRKSRTIKRPVRIAGKGLFTGCAAILEMQPAEDGIVFELPGGLLTADAHHVLSTPRCTILGSGKTQVQTVEHLLAALKAYQIDHVRIKLDGLEVPILDGSALPFVALIEEAGVQELDQERSIFRLSSPVFWSQGEAHLVALPAEEWKISYTLHYPQSSLIGSQFYSFIVEPQRFKEEIAPARTFCLYEEIAPLIENGWLKGGSLESALIIQGERVLNPGGLRLPQEMVRHKILDLIGDFSLMGVDLKAHILAIRSGHAANVAFAKKLLEIV